MIENAQIASMWVLSASESWSHLKFWSESYARYDFYRGEYSDCWSDWFGPSDSWTL